MKIKTVFMLITVLVIFVLTAVSLDLFFYAGRPADEKGDREVVVISPGQDFKTISNNLYQAGIIQHPNKFKLLVRLKGYAPRIKAGEYLLSSEMSPNKVLDIIVSGRVFLHRVTVPEGYNIFQISDIIEEICHITKDEFLHAATDSELLHKMDIDAETFEGYLFPDTYYFPRGITPEKIISTMVDRFREVFNSEWENRAEKLGMSVHEIVILASMIEKETGAAFERPLISSVFHNRLKKNMRLESDPTVIYGIKDFDGNITRQHLRMRTAYNTYKIYGLPAGPIANPGAKAIEAALYPKDTQYLFFVSKRDTTHQFSTNIDDHNKAVREYQLRR